MTRLVSPSKKSSMAHSNNETSDPTLPQNLGKSSTNTTTDPKPVHRHSTEVPEEEYEQNKKRDNPLRQESLNGMDNLEWFTQNQPPQYSYINPRLIAKDGKIDVSNPDHQRTAILNGYILQFIQQTHNNELMDNALWSQFHWDFDEWNLDTFTRASRMALTDLQQYLRHHGVNIPKASRPRNLAQGLLNLLEEEQEQKWTADQIERVIYEMPVGET